MPFLEAEGKGIFIDSLDLIYESAVNVDSSKAVFKEETDIERAMLAYRDMNKDFGKFLKENNFKWPFAITCFQKVYFNNDGSIDYFIFNFLGEPPYKISAEQEMKFKELLNKFISTYKFPITADMKYTQCSTIVYESK